MFKRYFEVPKETYENHFLNVVYLHVNQNLSQKEYVTFFFRAALFNFFTAHFFLDP